MKRLFTFGCSFTQYWRWPTWADALGKQYDFYENWGMCGAGNSLIFYSLIECHQRNLITAQDDVWIMWTNTSREDRWVKGRWLAAGNVYWTAGNPLGDHYIKNFTCERGYLIRDLALISAARDLLISLKCNWKFLSMVPLDQSNEHSDLGFNPQDDKTDNRDVIDLYRDTIDCISPSVFDVIFRGDWKSRQGIQDQNNPRQRDFHPTPIEHLDYLDSVCPGWIIDSRTRDWMRDCEERARSNNLLWSQPNLPQTRF